MTTQDVLSGPGTERPRRSRRAQWTGSNTPARLRRAGAVLVLGALLTAVVSLAGGTARESAASEAGAQDASVGRDVGEIYQALADADAMATSGYVSAGREPAAVRARYDADITRVGQRLASAAALIPADDPAAASVTTIVTGLPGYTGLVETARTYNRQGLPLGQSYLDLASRQMRDELLPAAAELRASQTAALNTDYRAAGSLPIAVLLLGVALLAGGIHLARGEFRRTHRVLSPGLVAAGGLVVAALLWWVLASAVGGGALASARQGSDAANALDDARALVLQARSNESLVLVARSGGSASDQGFTDTIDRLLAADGPLVLAEGNGAGVDTVRIAAVAWSDAHRRLRALDDGGSYTRAVSSAVGTGPGSSGAAFAALDAAVADAGGAARARFTDDVASAGAATTLLGAGPAVLFLLAAGGVAVGVGRRVEEYR